MKLQTENPASVRAHRRHVLLCLEGASDSQRSDDCMLAMAQP
jgi:hypothetical protein